MNQAIILRVDDVSAHTTPFELERIYGDWWRKGKPVCFSVIPFSAYRFDSSGQHITEPKMICQNRELVIFLNNLLRENLVEIALHGLFHHFGELACDYQAVISHRLIEGLSILRKTFPEAVISVLVPPHDYLSVPGLRAAHKQGLTVCSTWAATHGCTRFAHHIGRLRRKIGKHYGAPSRDIIPTDLNLDLLSSLPRIHRTAVLVQHYWYYEDCRWMMQLMDYEAKRYADVLDHHDYV